MKDRLVVMRIVIDSKAVWVWVPNRRIYILLEQKKHLGNYRVAPLREIESHRNRADDRKEKS